ncbi:MAG: hypothetical protein IT331_05280 [Anaerolineae bacterium]|nr:hypothetical protein [Anaerolineae bacterium]
MTSHNGALSSGTRALWQDASRALSEGRLVWAVDEPTLYGQLSWNY